MSILASSWRISQLIQQKSEYQHRLHMITTELNDLKRYGENIADGCISIGEILRTPTSMYRRNMAYLTYADAYSQNAANIQMDELTRSPYYIEMMRGQTAEAQQYYAQMMSQQFKKAAAQQFAKYEAAMIHEKEAALEQEQETTKEDLETIKNQLASLRQENKESINDFFGNGGRA